MEEQLSSEPRVSAPGTSQMPYFLHYGNGSGSAGCRGGCRTMGAIAMTNPIQAQTCRASAPRPLQTVTVRRQWIEDLYQQRAALRSGYRPQTDPSEGAKGISLIVVEEAQGFSKGRNESWAKRRRSLRLLFRDCRVPAENLVGEEVFQQLYSPQERLNIAQAAVVDMERAIALTLDFVKERKAFGHACWIFKIPFRLAECKTEALLSVPLSINA